MSTADREQNNGAVFPPPLAIVGIGCLFPKADSSEAFWANIKGGVDAVGEVPESHWAEQDYFDKDAGAADMTYAKRGAFLEPVEFNPLEFGITPNNLEAIDTTQLLGLVVAREALRDAGYATGKDSGDGKSFNRERTSVILGVTGALEMVIGLGARLGHPKWRKALKDAGVEKGVAEDVVARIAEQYVPWQENSFPGLLGNVAAGRIANKFDLGGTNCVVDAACASSLSALHMAAMELYAGRSDMAITGGIDTFNDIFMYMCFSKTPALSPTGDSRPFAGVGPDGKLGADGTILGEGLGVIVIKRLADALRDGDNIRAVIRSIGSSSDGKGNAVYAPSANGQVRCLMSAYKEAGVGPETIELIEAHGTGTKVGDAVEAKALNEVFTAGGKEGTWCALGSVKSMVGHTKAAAGIAGLIKATLALEHKVLPPTIKVAAPLENLEAGSSALYVNTEKRPWVGSEEHPRRAGVSAFGFGGSNFHCVMEEAGPEKKEVDWDDSVQVLAFSGETRGELTEQLAKMEAGHEGSWKKLRTMAAEMRAKFKGVAKCRLVMVAQKGVSDVKKMVKGAVQMMKAHPERENWNTPEGTYFGAGKGVVGKLAAIFPGQGSQYVGMLRDLACQFPEMIETLEEGDKAFGVAKQGERLSDQIYPVPAFTDEARAAQQKKLSDTRVAQPALGVASFGAWKVLQRFGVKAEAAAGHSFGELVALCASGKLDKSALHKLAKERGAAMAELAGTAFSGAMLAVMATLAVIQQFIDMEKLDLVIANKNAPDQVVLSGGAAEIARAAELLEGRSIKNRKLPVSAAFHSPMVAAAEKPFAAALAGVKFETGQMPVYANTTGEVYPAEERAAKGLLAGQLARPVEFMREIENMYGAGVRTFLEVGPGGKLSGLVRAILAGRPHDAIALDSSNGKRSGVYDLGCALAQLAALGHSVDLTGWDGKFAAQPVMAASGKPAMSVELTGANYVKPRAARPAVMPVAKAEVSPREVVAAKVPPLPVNQQEGNVALSDKSQASRVNSLPVSASPASPLGGGVSSPGVAQALAATQAGILALQKMQEQTAALHGQYLRGQEVAQGTIAELIRQQMALMAGGVLPTLDRSGGTLSGHSELAGKNGHQSVPVSLVAESPVVRNVIPATREVVPVSPAVAVAAPVPKVVAPVPIGNGAVRAAGDGRVEKILLGVIAEKTGYPVEMLEMGMSLDGDLGIDSIKRVEIFSALQGAMPEAPVVKPEDLGRLQTLAEIVVFLGEGATANASNTGMLSGIANCDTKSESLSAPLSMAHSTRASAMNVEKVLLEVIAEKTGYPVEMLEMGMSLDGDLGIDSIKRVEIFSALQGRMPEAPVVKPEDLGRLQTLAEIVAFLGNSEFGIQNSELKTESTQKETVVSNGHGKEILDRQVLTVVPLDETRRERLALPKGALIWVTEDGEGLAGKICAALKLRQLDARVVGLDAVPGKEAVAGLLMVAPHVPPAHFIQNAFKLMQRVGPMLREAGKTTGAFLASASSMDGSFGLNGHTPRNPLMGGLAGLVKTASHEWPELSCKSLDLAHDAENADDIAEQIADELLLKGPAEVGISAAGRCEIRLVRKALNGEVGKTSLLPGDVVVVTGGARGVTAAVSIAVAKSYGCKLLLLGRSAAPAPEPEWLRGLTEESAIKKAYADHLEGSATPRVLQDEYRRVIADREVRATLEQIEATGAEVMYRSLDVRDVEAVTEAIAEARANFGPIRGIIHGAGVLQDRLIEDKTAEQFDAVFSTKVGGFNALLHAVAKDDLKVIVAFSSTTGRFGRKGQIAYAAANEVLNKLAQQEAHQRKNCRVLSMNWGPWEGGMVTPQLRRVFENEGVGLIPLQAGADYLVREMSTPAGGPVEILILGPGSKDVSSKFRIQNSELKATSSGQMVVAFEQVVDVETHPILRSHVIKGKAVVPAALIVEWLAHGAMHENPGLVFHGFEELRITKGMVLSPREALAFRVMAGAAVSRGGLEYVPVELRSGLGVGVLHARATIVLTAQLPGGVAADGPLADQTYSSGSDVYGDGRLFHGADLRGIKKVVGWSEEGMSAMSAVAPAPGAWMRSPLRSGWLADPLALDGAFQLMILWCFEARGIGSLPTGVGSYRQFVRAFPADGVRINICVTDVADHAATAAIEFVDSAGGLVARMEGYECVMDGTLEGAFALNQLEG